jgi:hypothetical protein
VQPHELTFWRGCRESLPFFTTKGLGLKWPQHYSEWQSSVLGNKRGLFEAPRGSWKTYFFSLAYPLWRILRGKTEVLLTSDSEGQAIKNLRLIRQTIETREELSPMRPSTKELWGTDQISFPNGSLVQIMGFGTSKRGTHPDIIICDDIEGENNRMSREDRDRMYFGVIAGMCLPHTELYTVGTPMEFGDILEQLSKNDAYARWRRPSEKNGVNQYTDIWTDEWLSFRKREMGSLNYAREMLLQRVDPATQPFKTQYEELYKETPARFQYVVTVCDPAYSENQGDYSAIVTVGFTGGNHAYVLEAKALRREDPGAIVRELIRTIRAFQPTTVGIEKRKGDAISYSFREARTRLNLWDFKYIELQSHGVSKEKRINMVGGLVSRWEARSVHIHPEMKQLREQLYAYRFDDSQKEHDDLVDALAYCFHPDMIRPNDGPQNIPINSEEAMLEGKGRFKVGQGMTQQPTSVYDWMNMKSGVSRGTYRWSSIEAPAFSDPRTGE